MIRRYAEFLAENVQRSNAVVAERMRQLEALKQRLTRDNTLGYLGKLTDFLFQGATPAQIDDAYERLLALRRANVRVDVEGVDTIGELRRVLSRLEADIRVKQVISKLPPAQKQWFSGMNMSEEDRGLLSTMATLDTAPFMRMVSQYRDKETLTAMAKSFVKAANKPADRAYFKGLEKGGLRIVHEDDRTIIFHTATHKDLLAVAGDTAWCIKTSASFKSYTDGLSQLQGRRQFVLIDLDRGRWDPLFKVGFTTSPVGAVTNAHDTLNNACIPHVRELLAERGIVTPGATGGAGGPDPATGALGDLIRWVEGHPVAPEQADEWLEKLRRRRGVARSLVREEDWYTFLARLLRSSARGRYLTSGRVDELVGGIVKGDRYKEELMSALNREGLLLPDLDRIEMEGIFDDGVPNTMLLPHMHLISLNIFHGEYLERCVAWIIGILGSREAHRARPDLGKQVMRLIKASPARSSSGKAKRAIMVAAWEKAVNGKSPDYGTISAEFDKSLDEDDGEAPRKYRKQGAGDPDLSSSDRVEILSLLRVRHPFDEDRVLSNMFEYTKWSGLDLLDFGQGVTLRDISNYHHDMLFAALLRVGVTVTVEANASDVLKKLKGCAIWSEEGDRYVAKNKKAPTRFSVIHRCFSHAPSYPAWLDSEGLRKLVARKDDGGFEWAAGTQFPVTLRVPGKFEVIIKGKSKR